MKPHIPLEDSLVDEHGGIKVPLPAAKEHKCVLPAADTSKLLAYRTGCCMTWYKRYYANEDYSAGWRWTKMWRWQVRRWQKKGRLPI